MSRCKRWGDWDIGSDYPTPKKKVKGTVESVKDPIRVLIARLSNATWHCEEDEIQIRFILAQYEIDCREIN